MVRIFEEGPIHSPLFCLKSEVIGIRQRNKGAEGQNITVIMEKVTLENVSCVQRQMSLPLLSPESPESLVPHPHQQDGRNQSEPWWQNLCPQEDRRKG